MADEDGRPRCGAQLRCKPHGTLCRRWPAKGRKRCRLHGGTMPRGAAHPYHGRQPPNVEARNAGSKAWWARRKELHRLGIIDTIRTHPLPSQRPQYIAKALEKVREMKKHDQALAARRAGGEIVDGEPSFGKQLQRLTGHGLDFYEQILTKKIAFTDRNKDRIRIKLEAAAAVMRTQLKADENLLRARRANMIPEMMRRMAKVMADDPEEDDE